MKDFMADNPQYSKEQIFAAADKLLSEHIGELRYLIKADNFIYKNGHSTLLSYLEDMGEEWEMYNSTDDMA
jgi:hypothetical protein